MYVVAIKAVQELASRYKQVQREIYRLREGCLERVELEKELSSIQKELTQIFELCDDVLEITKHYKRQSALAHMFEDDSDSDISCLD